jgi:hypothetical protein
MDNLKMFDIFNLSKVVIGQSENLKDITFQWNQICKKELV